LSTLTFPYREREVLFPAGAVRAFDPSRWIDPKKSALMDRFAQMAVAAAQQAWDDSGLQLDAEALMRTGTIIGTGVGGQNTLEESYNKLLDQKGSGRVHPFTIPKLMANAGASHISMTLGILGPGFTVASACASALHAMATTLHMLRTGFIDRAVTGGAESCLTLGTLRGWEALRVMAPDVCRPFSAGRAGMVVGEGAAMFVLEREADAKARGAKIYAEIAGFGLSSDAKDLTSPDVDGASRAITLALADAGLVPDDIDYVNAHGTGTKINDATETQAIKRALGDRAGKIPVSASKSQFGHALGAAGALETLATILALRDSFVPPTLGYLGPDPECDLDVVPNAARQTPLRAALKNAFAFGGLNAVLAIKKV
jgi:nodulation protein E